MRGVDEDSGEFLGRSKGEMRREALSVLELAHGLVEQPAARLLQLPMSEDLLALAVAAQKITAQIARKRAVGFLAKKLRREDDETLEALRTAMSHEKADSRRESAALHRIEALRDQMVAVDGDSVLNEFLLEFPHADRQQLRQLARNAREEKLRNKPPHAYRELFRELRDLMQDVPGAD
jgi:ribosome-associated protein